MKKTVTIISLCLIMGLTNSLQASDVALTGTAYRWSGNESSTSNSNKIEAPGLNDGDIITDIRLAGGGEPDWIWSPYEAAGLVFSTKKTVTKVEYINGTFAGIVNGICDDGCFDEGIKLQVSEDGETWTDATGWTLEPEYKYWDTSVSGTTFTFNGKADNILGIRVTGKVKTSGNTGSWEARTREITAYSGQNVNVSNTQDDTDVILYSTPDNSILTVTNLKSEATVKVVSISGSVISEVLAKGGTVDFDVSHWAKGAYLFYIQSAKSVVVKKAIIQ